MYIVRNTKELGLKNISRFPEEGVAFLAQEQNVISSQSRQSRLKRAVTSIAISKRANSLATSKVLRFVTFIVKTTKPEI